MNKIETKILNCSAVREAEKNMVFAARLTQRGHMIHSMDDLVKLYEKSFLDETVKTLGQLPHPAIQKFTVITVAVVGASRRFLSQITRHQNEVKFMSASLQYSNYSGEAEFAVPYEILTASPEIQMLYEDSCRSDLDCYGRLCRAGIGHDAAGYATPQGLRNAILLLLSRYGIRSRDISALTFENIDFSNNRLHFIQQKTGDLWEMELFPEVKDALQDYILTARPPLPDCPNVFLTSTIPYKPLDSFAINTAIWMLVAKSDVDITDKRHGSRAFRSSIASNMVNDRVSTEVVRKVLGHGTKHAIRHYARLDIENMRLCPLATPEPTGIFAEMLLWKGGEHHV